MKIYYQPHCCGASEGGGSTNDGSLTASVDLLRLPYADNDADAGYKNIALKAYYLASQVNTMGVKYGTLVRREF
ncbi:MAG: hypothetical protein U5L45_15890 [Saprospiraceae bacterium]|nr:hypothetical protein [Saprospiraceae bacterium]